MADALEEDFNLYAECEACGDCCSLTVLAMTPQEVEKVLDYAKAHDVEAQDNGPGACPFRAKDMRCKVYPVRPRTCRMHNCKVTRRELSKQHPELEASDDARVGEALYDTRLAFIDGELVDPRTMSVEWIVERYSR